MSPDQPPVILIVDDTKENLSVIGGLLEDSYRVRVANSGERAIKVANGEPRPDLILLDVMMPGMDGPSTLARLRADPATAAIPVIFLTAKVQPPEVVHYQSLGALDVIAKPFDPMTLAAQVRQIWSAAHG